MCIPHGSALLVEFDHAQGLHSKDGNPIVGFEVSADGRKFVPAQAEISDGKLLVRAEEVPHPQAMRYGWTVFIKPNLVNEAYLPAVPVTLLVDGPGVDEVSPH